MALPRASTVPTIVRGALGVALVCGGLLLVGIALFGVAAIVRPSERSNTSRGSANSGDGVRRTTWPARSEGTITEDATAHARNVEHLTETTLVADFVVHTGETYEQAGTRLTEVGKELCLIPGAETAILNVVSADNNTRLGQLTLPLASFLDFHVGDPTDRLMAAKMWKTNAVLALEQALRRP